MTISISSPSGVLRPNVPALLYFTPSEGTYVRVWCHAAPTGSRLGTQIELHASRGIDPDTHVYFDRTRVLAFDGKPIDPWRATFEKGGRYVLYAQAYERDEYGGGYQGSPAGGLAETLIGSEQTLDLFVAQTTTQTVGVGADTATLTIVSLEDTVLEATLTAPRSQLAKLAVESDAVLDAVDALVGADLTAAGTTGDLDTWSARLFDGFNTHLYQDSVHFTDDTFNTIPNSYASPPNAKAFVALINEAIRLLRQHVTNDSGSGVDTTAYHHGSDRAAIPLYTGVTTLAEAHGALADLFRCFGAHQLNDAVHDTLNTVHLGSLPLTQRVHSAFLSVLAAPDTATPPAQQDGVQTLIAVAGFVEAPLP